MNPNVKNRFKHSNNAWHRHKGSWRLRPKEIKYGLTTRGQNEHIQVGKKIAPTNVRECTHRRGRIDCIPMWEWRQFKSQIQFRVLCMERASQGLCRENLRPTTTNSTQPGLLSTQPRGVSTSLVILFRTNCDSIRTGQPESLKHRTFL